jgi:hypothetical protein
MLKGAPAIPRPLRRRRELLDGVQQGGIFTRFLEGRLNVTEVLHAHSVTKTL